MPISKQISDIVVSPLSYSQFSVNEDGWTVDLSAGNGTAVAAGGKLEIEQTSGWGVTGVVRGNSSLSELGPVEQLANVFLQAQVVLDPAHLAVPGVAILGGVLLSGTDGAGDITGAQQYCAYIASFEDGFGDGDVKLMYGLASSPTILDLGVKFSLFAARPVVGLQITCTGSTFDAYLYVNRRLRAKQSGITTASYGLDVGSRPALVGSSSINASLKTYLDDVALVLLTVGGSGGGGGGLTPTPAADVDNTVTPVNTTTANMTFQGVTGQTKPLARALDDLARNVFKAMLDGSFEIGETIPPVPPTPSVIVNETFSTAGPLTVPWQGMTFFNVPRFASASYPTWAGVSVGNSLVITAGPNAATYVIDAIVGGDLLLSTNFVTVPTTGESFYILEVPAITATDGAASEAPNDVLATGGPSGYGYGVMVGGTPSGSVVNATSTDHSVEMTIPSFGPPTYAAYSVISCVNPAATFLDAFVVFFADFGGGQMSALMWLDGAGGNTMVIAPAPVVPALLPGGKIRADKSGTTITLSYWNGMAWVAWMTGSSVIQPVAGTYAGIALTANVQADDVIVSGLTGGSPGFTIGSVSVGGPVPMGYQGNVEGDQRVGGDLDVVGVASASNLAGTNTGDQDSASVPAFSPAGEEAYIVQSSNAITFSRPVTLLAGASIEVNGEIQYVASGSGTSWNLSGSWVGATGMYQARLVDTGASVGGASLTLTNVDNGAAIGTAVSVPVGGKMETRRIVSGTYPNFTLDYPILGNGGSYSGNVYISFQSTSAQRALDTVWDYLASGSLAPKSNAAGSNPTANDDSTLGYSIGSRWFNLTYSTEFVCLFASPGVAVWVPSTASWNTVAPTVNDDVSTGYREGHFWADTILKRVYVCVDSALGAAVWLQIGVITENIPILSTATSSLATVNALAAEWMLSFQDTTAGTHAACRVLASNNGAAVVSHVEYGNIGTFTSYTINVTCTAGVMTLSVTNTGPNTIDVRAKNVSIGA